MVKKWVRDNLKMSAVDVLLISEDFDDKKIEKFEKEAKNFRT